jgi:hypothetical protein
MQKLLVNSNKKGQVKIDQQNDLLCYENFSKIKLKIKTTPVSVKIILALRRVPVNVISGIAYLDSKLL